MTAYLLFVDDDVANLIVWETACADRFPVLTASDGEQALELLRVHEIGVVISDQRMPGMSGIELLEQVRRESPNTVRMLITAHSDLAVAVDAINRGGVHRYLRKPCALAELRKDIADAMALYALREQARAVEQRLMLTERVYTLGLVAAGLGRKLGRPAEIIRESMTRARAEVHAIVTQDDPGAGHMSTLRRQLDSLETRLSSALLEVERLMELAADRDLVDAGSDTHAVDVVAVLQLALSLARGEQRRDVDVSLDLHEVPMARGTSQKLSQVILSLLVNALDAVSSLPPTQREVTVRLDRDHDHVLLDVLDNGPSIVSSDLERLFDPLDGSSVSRRGGLSLAVSKALVEEMGGQLRVENRDTHGAAFRVILRAA